MKEKENKFQQWQRSPQYLCVLNAREWHSIITYTARLLAAMFFLALPAATQAQFTFTTNSGAITITGYTGPGGAITIPSKTNGYPVTAIAGNAFYGLTSLTSVLISSNVTSVGVNAFFLCNNLTAITVDPLNPVYSGLNGVLLYNNQTTLIAYPEGKAGSYSIPNTVTMLADHSLYDCTKLTGVTIPNSVNNIGPYAFGYCTGLSAVTIPGSVTNIGTMAFGNCSGLMGLYFAGNPPPVGSYAFSGSTGAIAYYLPGATGWGPTYGGPLPPYDYGLQTVLWNPQAVSLGVRTNRFSFYIAGTSNDVVIVEFCTNLASAVWLPLPPSTLSNTPVYFNDSGWTNSRARFYRLRSP